MYREIKGTLVFKGEELEYNVNYRVEDSLFIRDVSVEYLEEMRNFDSIPVGCRDFEDTDNLMKDYYKYDVLTALYYDDFAGIETQKEFDNKINIMIKEFDDNDLIEPDVENLKDILDYDELI